MSAWIVYSKDGLKAKCETRKLTYSGEFMGACSVSVSVSSPSPIEFSIGDFLIYRGERFEINYDPSVIKSSRRYSDGESFQYENIVFNSLSDELTRCDFLDYVSSDNFIHYSSLPTFSFFADSIERLAERIQANLDRVYKGDKKWTVEVHEEYEGKSNVNISVSNMTVWDALALANTQFGATFIIKNRTITIGTAGIPMEKVFSYGKGNGLSKIERNAESSQKIITRLRAYGSTRNMPSGYYHNISGSAVPNNMAIGNLMLPDFPNKTLDPYIDSKNIDELGVREGTVFFDGSGDLEEIYPSMEGMTAEDLKNAGVEIQSTGALDVVVSAEHVEDEGKATEGEEIQATFEVTLKDIGFDINDHLAATLSMKDGMCGGREFEIVSCKKEGSNYILTCNRTEDTGLGLYFPYKDYPIRGGDKFVILNIEMPDVYVKAASQRLLSAAEDYLAKNDYVRYSYTPTVDNIFMARQHDEAVSSGLKSIHDTIKEGDLMLFEDEDLGVTGNIIIDTLTIKEDLENSLIPEYEITLKNEKTVGTIEKIQHQIDSIVRNGTGASENGGKLNTEQITAIVKAVGDKTFLRKDKNDRTPFALSVGGNLTAEKGFILNGKQISDVTRFYDEEKPAHSSDAEIYSALMTDMRIEEEFENIGERFIRKDVEDTAHKHITFEEGITVQGLAKTMNLEVEELATIARAIVTTLSSSKFVDGFAGEGYQIWQDIASGDWNMTLDKLTVRKVMMIYELVIQKIRSVGGMIVVSAANGKVKSVERVGIEYKFTFEDTNTFAQNDLMRCQVFSPSGLKYYWVEVTHVDGENVYARVADFQGVTPTAGDECVLMGNTKNKLRQNMLLISATEDGQPRFDCYDGIRTKNFEGCLRTRVGCLDGITDSRFPSDLQPKGYGLYADNCFLTGVFVLSNGKDVQTQFAIMEGMIRTEISSVRSEINAKDNYLTNASFSSNLESWTYKNDVYVFSTSGGLLHFNGNFYSVKENFAGVVAKDSKNVLRIKNSFITQKNADYNIHPSFDKVIDGDLYSPRMFYISFKYMCASEGTLKVYFKDEKNDGTFEAYSPIIVEEIVPQNLSFEVAEYEGKWNGTGDFYLSFTGDIYIYDLALSDNALADVEEKFNLRFEATDKKIQANLEHINKNGEKMEQYYSEFKLTAESLESSFNKKVSDQYSKITSEYSGKISQTAQELRSDYTELVEDAESNITSAYKSLISQTAREIRAEMSESLEDLEDGLVADYESQISLTARELRTEFSEDLTDLETGLTSSYKSAISQTAKEIRAELSSVEEDLDGRITENSTDISIQAGKITSLISTTETLGDEISSAQSSITQQADSIETLVSRTDKISGRVTTTETAINQHTTDIQALAKKVTVDSSGNITNISKSGLVLDSEFASMFSTQVASQGIAKTASLSAYVLETELETLVSKIEISADQIDLSGVVTYDMLDGDLQDELDGKATSSALTTAKNQLNNSISTLNTTVSGFQTEVSKKASVDSLNSKVTELNDSIASKANKDLTNAVVSGSTLIVGGYINADLIDADAISTNSLVTKNDNTGYAMTIENGYVKLSNGSYTPLQINSSSYGASIFIEDRSSNSASMTHNGFYHNHSSGKTVNITGGGITLSQGSFLKGFALGNVGTSISYDSDFVVLSSNGSLPSPSANKGKVIFVKFSGNRTLSGSIIPRNSTSSSSVTHSNLSAFYISNGSYWYEFLSVD